MSTESVILRPRPYAQYAGSLLLLPLLQQPKPPSQALPAELWSKIVGIALESDSNLVSSHALLRVCKYFKDIALPLVYAHVHIMHITSLEKFYLCLHTADQKWDSIRRIPYSTPGRWVQTLDLSDLSFTSRAQALSLDSILTKLFPLVPFLTRLAINPSFTLSCRAMTSLSTREGIVNLRSLEGICYTSSPSSLVSTDVEESHVKLLRSCQNLEHLEVTGLGIDASELDFLSVITESSVPASFTPLNLYNLVTLTLLSMHSSPLMLYLLVSPLPSLQKLTLTPYDDIPYPSGLVSQFIKIHGQSLRSLILFTPKSWPTRLHPSPDTLLQTSPALRYLSLENPLPALTLQSLTTHPLQVLSIPRPNADFWRTLERLLPQLPSLRAIRIRDVRWLRTGITHRAQEAGIQGEMREWRRSLIRHGIRVLDADWKESK